MYHNNDYNVIIHYSLYQLNKNTYLIIIIHFLIKMFIFR